MLRPLRTLAGGIALVVLALSPAQAPAQAEETFSAAEEDAIRGIVRDYLIEHPEVIMEAIAALEAREAEREEQRRGQAISQFGDALRQDPQSPVLGNPEGDVTVVEFSDYFCPYCRRIAQPLMDYVEDDGNVRHVVKEFPILGPESVTAARIALAAERQGVYLPVRQALISTKGRPSEAAMLKIAEKAGADIDKLKADMKAPEVTAQLEKNQALAQALGITGTPAFLVGDEFIGGAVPVDEFDKRIDAIRDRKS